MKPEIYNEFSYVWTTEKESHFLVEGRYVYNAREKTLLFISRTPILLEVIEQMRLHGNRVAKDYEEADFIYRDVI